MRMKAIFSVDNNWGLGKDNQLLLRLPADMKHFVEKTMGHPVIMGRKTFLSLPKGALPGRRNIVFSRSGFTAPNTEVVANVPELLALLGAGAEDAFVIGGGEIYKLLLPYTHTIYVTKFDINTEADTHFYNLDQMPEWMLYKESPTMEENGVRFRFCTYRRCR